MSKLPQVAPLWRIRFDLIEKAGGPNLPHRAKLSGSERFRILFNFWAMVFAPLYYLAKGMWRKALTAWLIGMAFILLINLIQTGDELNFLKYGVNTASTAWFALRANIDYYRKMVLDDNGWW